MSDRWKHRCKAKSQRSQDFSGDELGYNLEIKPLNHNAEYPDEGIRLITGPQRWKQKSESAK